MKIYLVGINHDTDKMTTAEVKKLLEDIQASIDGIEYSLALAAARKYENGQASSATWFAKASYALKRRKRDEERLRAMLGAMGRLDQAKSRALAYYFMAACREYLSDNQWKEIYGQAEALKSSDIETAAKKVEEFA